MLILNEIMYPIRPQISLKITRGTWKWVEDLTEPPNTQNQVLNRRPTSWDPKDPLPSGGFNVLADWCICFIVRLAAVVAAVPQIKGLFWSIEKAQYIRWLCFFLSEKVSFMNRRLIILRSTIIHSQKSGKRYVKHMHDALVPPVEFK